ncbi:unnamed protein product [Triticum turgidum subsp. durum]|uniref:Phytocyanin domain-containing protein n=1 Tax=Triticum turgidum subsp. durum TaxID=4567 RepID=A0A9R0TUY6_TRITD|nr:unnamed protein product [Triticum turgidum subsp. durum]
MASTGILLLLLATAAIAGPRHAGATEYTVGDSDGWTIGPNYLAWSQKYNFTTGDTLAFNYVPRQHDVYRVTRDAFQTCEPTAGQTVRKWASGRDVLRRRGRAASSSAVTASPAGLHDCHAATSKLQRVRMPPGVAGLGEDFLPRCDRDVDQLAVMTVMNQNVDFTCDRLFFSEFTGSPLSWNWDYCT